MKMILKSTLAAAAFAGAMLPTLGFAQVGASVGVGMPGMGNADCGPSLFQYGSGYSPCDGQTYYDPIYYDGSWYHGPYRWRTENGQRQFFINGGWHQNEWQHNSVPASMTFHNGGSYSDGRYNGFGDASRINARVPADNRQMGNGRLDTAPDRGAMAHPDAAPDRGTMSQDAPHGDDNGPHN
jgi:hypothetical protein